LKVDFYEPPRSQRVGGLDHAIRSLEGFLRQAQVEVLTNPPAEDVEHDPPDVVHFHGLWQPLFLRVSALCRRRRVPYVVSSHGMLEPWALRHKRWKKWPWYHLFERRHLAEASALLATSKNEAQNLTKLFPSRDCPALPLGLTSDCGPGYSGARRKLGWSESEVVLLFLSRIHPKKGLDVLLGALAGLDLGSRSDIRLAIVGGGDQIYVNELRGFASRQSTRLPRIDWLGEISGDAKWPYFQGADLFCLPSHSENFGLAILEALQVGTRVLTTDRTPWDMVPSWSAGMIAQPEKEVVQLALRTFLSNPEWTHDQRETLASRIHREFSWDAVGPAYLRFYERIARGVTTGLTDS
jgi:glycosyltransferase involved in cell wall biosynthesis